MDIHDLNENVKMLAESAMETGDYDNAFEYYKIAAEKGNDSDSQFNLGILYATGKGIQKDLKNAAIWFKKANDSLNNDASKYLIKATWDYFNEYISKDNIKELYKSAISFRKIVYGDAYIEDVNDMLEDIAANYISKKEYYQAYIFFRAMAEFGESDSAQYNVGMLALNGLGIEKNDLAAMYWFDKATDQGNEEAHKYRDGILGAYVKNLGIEETKEHLNILTTWCLVGSKLVPLDDSKAHFWNMVMKEL